MQINTSIFGITAARAATAFAALGAIVAEPTMAATPAVASVVIEQPGRLQKTADLEFGRLITTGTAGTITIAPDGAVAVSGGVVPEGGGTHPAGFLIQTRLIDFIIYRGPSSGDTIELRHTQDASASMSLSNFTTDLRSGFYLFRREVTFHVGGTLAVAANQKPGRYRGTFVVTVDLP